MAVDYFKGEDVGPGSSSSVIDYNGTADHTNPKPNGIALLDKLFALRHACIHGSGDLHLVQISARRT